jgi:CO/xanthine dehydrogenase Mo-binding subunit
VISPDGVRAQVEGGIIQSASWTLKERVLVEADGSQVHGWEDYPTLPFSEIPSINVSILERNDLSPVGAGEGAQGPTSAAIANAVYSALGVRVRHMPLTPDEVTRAMQ